MRHARSALLSLVAAVALAVALAAAAPAPAPHDKAVAAAATPDPIAAHAVAAIARGRTVFRDNTFGSEAFFSDVLHLDQVLSQVPPRAALGLGVKVDVDRLPGWVRKALAAGQVDLDDPAVTRLLFQRAAIVGVKAQVEGDHLTHLGITCAFCHSTVDNSLAPGVGHRRDGWANRDLDVGSILALSPNLQPIAQQLGVDVATVKAVLHSWGPGEFDALLNVDGKALRPDGGSASVLIPPAFGLAGVNLHTYEGWGSVPYWNAFVASNEMGGLGRFFDPRLADAARYPVAAAAGLDDVREQPDLVSSHLADLQLYQLALEPPAAPAGSFDVPAAARGETLFAGKAGCATCHVPPLFTEPGWSLHTPEEIGIDSFQADRGPEGRYRTTPLRGLWSHAKGGFYHDGRFATLRAVVDHYDQHRHLSLAESEKVDLVEYLKSL
jgi:cytochrome c5